MGDHWKAVLGPMKALSDRLSVIAILTVGAKSLPPRAGRSGIGPRAAPPERGRAICRHTTNYTAPLSRVSTTSLNVRGRFHPHFRPPLIAPVPRGRAGTPSSLHVDARGLPSAEALPQPEEARRIASCLNNRRIGDPVVHPAGGRTGRLLKFDNFVHGQKSDMLPSCRKHRSINTPIDRQGRLPKNPRDLT